MVENLRADLRRTKADLAVTEPGAPDGQSGWIQNIRVLRKASTWAVISYRFAHWANGLHVPLVRQLTLLTARLSDRVLQLWTKCSLAPDAQIGPGLVIRSCYGVFIGHTRIGADCTIEAGCIIQGRVGDNARFGSGAKLLADASIGNNVVVIAGSVVLADVPDNITVAGVPARRRLLSVTLGAPGSMRSAPQ